MSVRAFLSIVVLLSSFFHLAAEDRKRLDLDLLFHPERQLRFSGQSPPRLRWLPDGRHFVQFRDGEFRKIEAASGESQSLLDRAGLERAFASQSGFSKAEAVRAARRPARATSSSGRRLLFDFQDDLYLYDVREGRMQRLTDDALTKNEADFSPDERMVSFVRGNDIFVYDVERGRERRLTADGSPELLNGRLDWVYQEEIYGRGNFRAYWWSPDSSRVAYLQLDESPVPSFDILDLRRQPQRKEVTRYPKSGEGNPKVRLGVVSAAGGETQWIDHSAYEGQEILVVRVNWIDDDLIHQVQDREQTWLHVNRSRAGRPKTETVIEESSPAFVNVLGQMQSLDDGTFLWLSERTGWRHIYRYGADFKLRNAVTEGDWEVRSLHGADAQGWIYFSGTRRNPIGLDVYRIKADGSALTRLSQRDGTHRASFNPQADHYVDVWSDIANPPQVRLHDSQGQVVRVIQANAVDLLDEYDLGQVSLHKVPTRDGFMMEAMMIKPTDFDASKRYPVMSYTYSGPHAPSVRQAWGGNRMLFHRLLAQEGYIVWICDNRSASGKGIAPTWTAHRNLGSGELRDLEDGLAWLKKQPYIDPDRIGLWGWSYGGYMTSFALTHSKSFKIGIAGAPVTDWTLYDTVYTERYMGRPQTNPQGYEASSPLRAAADLHGKLLIIHGTIDDNVHMQNSIQFVNALQQAGKEFEFMIYPGSRHGVRDRRQVHHLYTTMMRFIKDNL